MNLPRLTLTVGISTRASGKSLVTTAESIVGSENVGKFPFMIVSDTKPIKKAHLMKLIKMGVVVRQNKRPGTLSSKMRQLIAGLDTDIFVFTQDDLEFSKDELYQMLLTFQKDPELTMAISKVIPHKGESFLEKVVEVGASGAYRVGESWNKGNNYLMANGRCIAFKVAHLKNMRIPDEVTNLDAYLYFENERTGGSFKFVNSAKVYTKSPKALGEHLNQSSRFQYSKYELVTYFGDMSKKYKIPFSAYVKAGISEFVSNPLFTTLYTLVFLYTRIRKKSRKQAINPLWKADLSTKKIG